MRRSGRPIIAQGTVTRGMTTHMLRFEWKASSFCGRYSLSLQELLRGRCVCRGNVVTARSSEFQLRVGKSDLRCEEAYRVSRWDGRSRLGRFRCAAGRPPIEGRVPRIVGQIAGLAEITASREATWGSGPKINQLLKVDPKGGGIKPESDKPHRLHRRSCRSYRVHVMLAPIAKATRRPDMTMPSSLIATGLPRPFSQ
jgi:hypothetical protein